MDTNHLIPTEGADNPAPGAKQGSTMRSNWRTIAFLGFLILFIATDFVLASADHTIFSLANYSGYSGRDHSFNPASLLILGVIVGAGCFVRNRVACWVIISLSAISALLPWLSLSDYRDPMPGIGIIVMLAAIAAYGKFMLNPDARLNRDSSKLLERKCLFIIAVAIAQTCYLWMPIFKIWGAHMHGWDGLSTYGGEDMSEKLLCAYFQFAPLIAALLVFYGNKIVRIIGGLVPLILPLLVLSKIGGESSCKLESGFYLNLIVSIIACIIGLSSASLADATADRANNPRKPLTAKQKRLIRNGIIAVAAIGLCIGGVVTYKKANTPEKLFEKGHSAYWKSDYDKAVSYFKKINDKNFRGYEYAQDICALYYLYEKPDKKKALKYVNRILDLDRYGEEATYSVLGHVYTDGKLAPEIPADKIKGAKYYRFSPHNFEKQEAAKVLYEAGLYDEVKKIRIKTPWEGLIRFYEKSGHSNYSGAQDVWLYFENAPDDPAYSFEKAELLLLRKGFDSERDIIPTLKEAKRLYQNASPNKKKLADMRIEYIDKLLDAYEKYSGNTDSYSNVIWTTQNVWGADYSYQGVHFDDRTHSTTNIPIYGWLQTHNGVQFGKFDNYYQRRYNGPGKRLWIWFTEDGWGWKETE